MKLLLLILAVVLQNTPDGRRVFMHNNTVMGYTDRKVSTADDELPPALLDWMQWSGTTEEITTSTDHVDPLLSTLWDQDAPYNDLCPEYEAGAKSATGCVATAMAQVMAYWQYPTEQFDWSNMLPDYANLQGQNATAEQIQAVAELMLACGESVQMDYGKSSGANTYSVPGALAGMFGYNSGARYLLRQHLSYSEWAELLRNELRQGRPVIYRGHSYSGGHCFVLDGFNEEGYFHVNWGWGGISNGWYRFTMLTPPNVGIGGGNSSDGYNYNQGMLVGLAPATILSTPVIHQIEADSMGLYKSSQGRDSIRIMGYANYSAGDTIRGDIGVALYQNGTLLRVLSSSAFTRPVDGAWNRNIKTTINNLTPGETYQLLAVWRDNQDIPDWQIVYGCNHAPCGRTLYATSSNTFTHSAISYLGSPLCNHIESTLLVKDHPTHLTTVWTTDSSEWTGRIALALNNGVDFQFIAYSGMDLASDRSDTLQITSMPITVPAGNYQMIVGYYLGNTLHWLPSEQSVNVVSRTTTEKIYPIAGSFELTDTLITDQHPNLEMKFKMQLQSSTPQDAFFSGLISMGVYDMKNKLLLSTFTPQYVSCSKQDTVALHLEGNVGDYLPDGRYKVMVHRRPTGKSGYTVLTSSSYSNYITVEHAHSDLMQNEKPANRTRKILHNGNLYILIDNRTYDIWGHATDIE